MKKSIQIILGIAIVIITYSCKTTSKGSDNNLNTKIAYDSHVHIMSPDLIAYWKELGIPFSKAEDHYANIDTILQNNQAEKVALIGMGYVYANPEYYQGDDSKERLLAENDYLLEVAKEYPNSVKPYFAIDPLQDYAISEIERCYSIHKKVGLKLHFSTSQVYLTCLLYTSPSPRD